MNKTSRSFFTIFVISLLMCPLTTGLLIYSYTFHFDADIQHFSHAPIVYCTYAALGLCAAVAAVGYFIAGRHCAIDVSKEKTTFAETFLAVIAALFFLLTTFLLILEGMPEERAAIVFIRIALAFASAIYFAVKAFSEKIKKNPAFGLLSIIPTLYFASVIVCIYFDRSYALNSEYISIEVYMLISFMLAVAFECALETGSPGGARKYIFGAAVAISAGGAAAISKLALSLLSGAGFTQDLMNGAFYTVIWLYITVRFAKRTVKAYIKEPDESAWASEGNAETSADVIEETTEQEDEPEAETNEIISDGEKTDKGSEPEAEKENQSDKYFTRENINNVVCDDNFSLSDFSEKIDEEDKDEFYFPSDDDDTI